MSDPIRTCIGCRVRAPRAELLRVVLRDAAVLPDPAAVLPGRGAWLHPVPDCVEQAVRRRAFGRALRSTAALDVSAVVEAIGGLGAR